MKKYILLLELLALHAAYIFASGARSFLIDIIFLFVVYVMMDKKISQSLKDFFVKLPKVVIVGIVLGSLFMVILVTILRKGEGSLPREIYRYFSICFPLFERHIDVKEASNIPYTYGWGLLHGIVKPEFVIVRKFFGLQFPSMLEQAATQIEWNNEFFAVGGGNANSFVTLFYYMYMDFGVPGIVFGCFFYGYLAQSVYKRVVMNPDSRMIAFYLLIAIGLFLSFARFHFTAHRYVYAFLILALSFRREPDAEIEPIGECA